MKVKLVISATFLFLFGCGLNTAGQGPDDDDSPYDIQAEEVEPDITDTADDRFELTEEDVSPETPDEVSEVDADETADEADSEEAEDAGFEDEASEEDGGTADPCERPDVPTTGVYVFFCFADDLRANMTLSLQIERGGLPVFPWAEILGCTVADSRSTFCGLPLYYNAIYVFNTEFELTYPGTGTSWTCGPGTDDVLWGVPRVWVNHVEQAVTTRANMDGGCNHLFTTPPSGPP